MKDDITDKLLLQVDGRQKLQAALIKSLRQNQELAGFDKEYLEHTSFGILVGYPDQAILSALQYWQQEDKYLNPFAEPLVDADIRGGSYYDCPQPVYRYQRHLVNDPVIQQHEQLWSRILWEYYHSEFHKVLAENKAYQDKVREIGIANT